MKTLDHTLLFDDLYVEGFALFLIIMSLHQPILYICLFIYIIVLRKRMKWMRFFLLASLIFLLFALINSTQNISNVSGQGKIIKIEQKSNYQLVTMRYHFNRYHIYDYKYEYHLGDDVIIDAEIEPYLANSNEFGFNFQTYFLSLGVYGKLENIEIYHINNGFHISQLRQMLLSVEANEWIKVFIFREDPNEDIYQMFNQLDLTLLLNVSGIHLLSLIMMIKKAMFHLNIKDQIQKFIIFFIYIMLYYLSNYDVTVLRLILMFLIIHINKIYSLKINKVDQIFIVFILMIVINRFLLYSHSFLIMFMIIIMIYLTSYLYEKYPPLMKRYVTHIIVLLTILPLQNHISLLYVLIFPVFMGVISNLIYPLVVLSLLIPNLNYVTNIMMELIINVLDQISSYKINLYFHKLSIYSISITYIAMILLFNSKSIKQVMLRLIIFLMAIFTPTITFQTIYNDMIDMIDVNQGDGFFIQTSGIKIVSDCFSGTYEYLINHGINQIDYLILSHSDIDHTKDASKIIENLSVKNIIINPYDESYQSYNGNIVKYRAGDIIKLKNQTIEFFNPIINYGNENNNSLVYKIKIGDLYFLMTGDAEFDAETLMIKTFREKLNIDVLKISHHGSNTSTSKAFIDVTSPIYAIISVGKDNRYNFPSSKTIDLLNQYHIKIYRTDLDGAVCYFMSFNRKKWKTFL